MYPDVAAGKLKQALNSMRTVGGLFGGSAFIPAIAYADPGNPAINLFSFVNYIGLPNLEKNLPHGANQQRAVAKDIVVAVWTILERWEAIIDTIAPRISLPLA